MEERERKIVQLKEDFTRFSSRLEALESETQNAISRLLEQRSRIEASGKRLANLHSQCLALRSFGVRIEEAAANYRRAHYTS